MLVSPPPIYLSADLPVFHLCARLPAVSFGFRAVGRCHVDPLRSGDLRDRAAFSGTDRGHRTVSCREKRPTWPQRLSDRGAGRPIACVCGEPPVAVGNVLGHADLQAAAWGAVSARLAGLAKLANSRQ